MESRLPRSFCVANWCEVLAAVCLAAPLAQAAVTPTVPTPYALQNNILYVAGSALSTSPTDGIIDTLSGFKYLNLSSTSEVISIDLKSDKTAFTGVGDTTPLVISLFAKTGSDSYVVVPIAGANLEVSSGDPALCTSAGSVCEASSVSSGYFFSANYSVGKKIRISLSPKAICEYANTSAQSITGCSGGAVALAPGSTVSFSFKFAIGASNASYVADVAGTNNDVSSILTVRFQDDASYSAGDLSCQAAAQAPVYFPGDSSIIFYPDVVTTFVTGSAITDGAPFSHVVFVANPSAVGTTAADWNSQTNAVSVRASKTGGEQLLTGFSNGTSYAAAFSIQDAAGLITGGGGSFPGGFCSYSNAPGITTSEVRGFLSESRCFIATAAFGDGQSPPVQVLRRFRDHVLLKMSWGKAFVDMYYDISPSLAEFMWTHPWLRAPIAALLIPVTAVVWMLLHPMILGIGGGLGLMLLGFHRQGARRIFSRSLSAGVMWAVSSMIFSVHAKAEGETGTLQPYIDRLNETMPDPRVLGDPDLEVQAGESYTEALKRRANTSQSPSEQESSFLDWIRQNDSGASLPAGQFLETESAKLRDQEAERGSRPSVIQAVQQGTATELEWERPRGVDKAFGFRMGAWLNVAVSADAASNSFTAIYPGTWTPDIQLTAEFQILQHDDILALGLQGQLGFSVWRGTGVFGDPTIQWASDTTLSGQTLGTTSRVALGFVTVPASLGPVLRLNVLKILRPYVFVGGMFIPYVETRSDAVTPNRGFSLAANLEGGIALQLDALDKKSRFDLWSQYSVKHVYLTAAYQMIFTVASPVSFNNSGIYAGFLAEL